MSENSGDKWVLESELHGEEWPGRWPMSIRLWTRHTENVAQRLLVISGGVVRMYPEMAEAYWKFVTDALPFNARWIRLDADDDGTDKLDGLWLAAKSLSSMASRLTASFAVT